MLCVTRLLHGVVVMKADGTLSIEDPEVIHCVIVVYHVNIVFKLARGLDIFCVCAVVVVVKAVNKNDVSSYFNGYL